MYHKMNFIDIIESCIKGEKNLQRRFSVPMMDNGHGQSDINELYGSLIISCDRFLLL